MRRIAHIAITLVCGTVATTANASEWAIGGGYLGETIAHPGLVGTIERRFQGDSPHMLLAAADLGFYWHPQSQWAPHVDVRGGWRYASERGYSADFTVGVGYLRSYIAAETVNFDNTGRSQLLIPIDIGFFGWNLTPDADKQTRFASSLRLMRQSPVNTHAVIRPALTLTLTKEL